LKFQKIQGIGNDYIYIDNLRDQIDLKSLPSLSIKMSDRHFGIGSDGVITVGKSHIADFKMNIFNSDGSEAEMCGNGIRGFVRYLIKNGLLQKDRCEVETKAGIKPVAYKNNIFTVNMGAPELNPIKVPVKLEGDMIIDHPIVVLDRDYRITCVSMGNPHCILFTKNLNKADVQGIGKEIEQSNIFPNRTNVEFVQIISKDEIKMRVWERGSGETLACGTGACASLVASVLNEKTHRKVKIHLLGGDLEVNWNVDDDIIMSGPAEFVFEGKWEH